ncbi:MAG: NIPSNAP family protein [Candidatus Rokubacteria bacterium 13_1_40CM_69_27]|nr:MAG: NIPSNAP family protein [Candidatus Rokubacteria bacterium 13_1_40CM_69_27]
MIYELRTYTLVPGKQGEYLKLSGEVGRKTRGDKYGKLEGYWSTEFGTLNQVVHLWSYADLNERERLRAELAQNADWTKSYMPQIRPLQLAQENKILSPQLPLKPPAESGYIYELRTYRTIPGKVAEWLGHFKAIMPVREKYSKNVGLWQTEMGQLNEAVHLWAYRDLNERAAVRAKALQDPQWQAFIGKATPLLVEMRSVVLNPVPFSPLK